MVSIALLFGIFGICYSLFLKYVKKSHPLRWATWSVFGSFFMVVASFLNKEDWAGWVVLWTVFLVLDLVTYFQAEKLVDETEKSGRL